MDNEKVASILIAVVTIFLVVQLWPLIKWLVSLILVLGILFIVYIYFQSKKVKKDIENDPNKYFSEQMKRQSEKEKVYSEDVIDVEFTVKEVDDSDD